MNTSQQDQAIKDAITGYVDSIPVPALVTSRQQLELRPRRNQLGRWSPVAVFVVLMVAFFFTGTAEAVYQRIFVLHQRSQHVANLETAFGKASFQAWISDQAQVDNIQEIGEGLGYSLIMYYKINGEEAFFIDQSAARGGVPRWDDTKIVQRDVNIQGSPAVIYESPVVNEQGEVVNRINNLYVMLDETNVTIKSPLNKSLSPDELIAIAQGLRRAAP